MREVLKEILVSLLRNINVGSDPDFIIIGAQKAGTTSLYNYLQQNPQVCNCLKKEVHYFDLNFNKNKEWYRAHFFKKIGLKNCVIGEASPLYMYNPDVPARLKRTYPNMKLIILLRDPVKRAISHYKHLLRHSLIPDSLSLKEVIKIEKQFRTKQSTDSYYDPVYSVLHRGEYVYQLRKWFKQFDRNQFLILRNEDFLSEPESTLSEVETFLNLEVSNYDISKKYNVSWIDGGASNKSEIEMLKHHYKDLNVELSELLEGDYTWQTTH